MIEFHLYLGIRYQGFLKELTKIMSHFRVYLVKKCEISIQIKNFKFKQGVIMFI